MQDMESSFPYPYDPFHQTSCAPVCSVELPLMTSNRIKVRRHEKWPECISTVTQQNSVIKRVRAFFETSPKCQSTENE